MLITRNIITDTETLCYMNLSSVPHDAIADTSRPLEIQLEDILFEVAVGYT